MRLERGPRRPGFDDFEGWWHREKNFPPRTGHDLQNRKEAEETWGEWIALGRPRMNWIVP